ncbi:hypothetical protein BMJ26_26155 [Sinorhizobium medicae]|nr:hypothetical protein BMJ31_25425 [Sinorhizobium medicae]PLU32720.1 hypothetical protein BMJ26_26155 [Sinorhizobium medicae]PLU39268.1 hypothetical protein BMJ28_11355 [Sinorhizobium medicae]PLU56001.1 hypothetical protein BMJ24_19835 [Sinorhizobium medicae]PLU72295.1 hypothetical protein BMJ20_06615 [Sinorhizobium medicae]
MSITVLIPYGQKAIAQAESANSAWAIGVTVRRDNQLGNSINLDGSVARNVPPVGLRPPSVTPLATGRTHIGVHAVW